MSFRFLEPQRAAFRHPCTFDFDYVGPDYSLYEVIRQGFLSKDKAEPSYLPTLYQSILQRSNQADVKASVKEFKLTENETLAMLLYTFDWAQFGVPPEGSLPYLLNSVDPFARSDARHHWRPFYFYLLKGFEKLPTFTGTAHKGIQSKLDPSYYHKKGWVQWDTLMSVSSLPPENTISSYQTILILEVSYGKVLGNISMSPTEGELLLIPDCDFLIKEVVPHDTHQGVQVFTLVQQGHSRMIAPNPFIAAQEGNIYDLRVWQEKNKYNVVGLNITDKEHNSAPLIYTAARFGRVEMVKYLVSEGVNLNVVQAHGSSALHAAAYYGHLEIVKLLVEAKIDVNIVNRYGTTARDEASDLVENGEQWKQIVSYLSHSK